MTASRKGGAKGAHLYFCCHIFLKENVTNRPLVFRRDLSGSVGVGGGYREELRKEASYQKLVGPIKNQTLRLTESLDSLVNLGFICGFILSLNKCNDNLLYP